MARHTVTHLVLTTFFEGFHFTDRKEKAQGSYMTNQSPTVK